MDKPEWCPQNVWDEANDIYDPAAWHIAKAILSAQSQAYIDAARIAEDWVGGAEYISAAILQRKEEIGR